MLIYKEFLSGSSSTPVLIRLCRGYPFQKRPFFSSSFRFTRILNNRHLVALRLFTRTFVKYSHQRKINGD